jgi:hypothetical protein
MPYNYFHTVVPNFVNPRYEPLTNTPIRGEYLYSGNISYLPRYELNTNIIQPVEDLPTLRIIRFNGTDEITDEMVRDWNSIDHSNEIPLLLSYPEDLPTFRNWEYTESTDYLIRQPTNLERNVFQNGNAEKQLYHILLQRYYMRKNYLIRIQLENWKEYEHLLKVIKSYTKNLELSTEYLIKKYSKNDFQYTFEYEDPILEEYKKKKVILHNKHLQNLLELEKTNKMMQKIICRLNSFNEYINIPKLNTITYELNCQCILEDIECKHIEECSICLEEFTIETLNILPCKHIYHPQCINQWMKEKKNCPKCRRSIK